MLTLGYCSGNGGDIAPFNDVFKVKQDVLWHGFDKVDAVVFWGGTDINPSLYGQKPHPFNQASTELSERDKFEWKAMSYCHANNIPMIGVCRGAQLMCAFAGGSLVQHMSHHNTDHTITTNTCETMKATSSHHQMMMPWATEHELIAWSTVSRSDIYEGEEPKVNIVIAKQRQEPEIVFFPKIKGLAIQGHPEWAVGSRFAHYCNELVKQYLLETADA